MPFTVTSDPKRTTFQWHRLRGQPQVCGNCAVPAVWGVCVLVDYATAQVGRLCDNCRIDLRRQYPPRPPGKPYSHTPKMQSTCGVRLKPVKGIGELCKIGKASSPLGKKLQGLLPPLRQHYMINRQKMSLGYKQRLKRMVNSIEVLVKEADLMDSLGILYNEESTRSDPKRRE